MFEMVELNNHDQSEFISVLSERVKNCKRVCRDNWSNSDVIVMYLPLQVHQAALTVVWKMRDTKEVEEVVVRVLH